MEARNKGQVKILEDKGYYRPAVVARRAKVNRTTVYRWIKDGKIQCIPFNGNYFVEWASVQKFLGALAPMLGLDDDARR